ncbi:hypothetical protein FQN60_017168 [Etheostoma spectabile]|uniref:Uncharacterized protein n=1 Tax=Etheostoma spectabile TaxID=54343 RepID=A0A5J5DER8_9PERO|nr:hypothetical protein FQN60_017168 [Etheostoma spectabile]
MVQKPNKPKLLTLYNTRNKKKKQGYLSPLLLLSSALSGYMCITVHPSMFLFSFFHLMFTFNGTPEAFVTQTLNCGVQAQSLWVANRCEYPSRNPPSPLDSPLPAICYIPSPLSTQADIHDHGTATQVRTTGERARNGRRTDGGGYRSDDAAVCLSLWETGGLDGGFVYSTDLDRGQG